ncbi:hypothetical protein [Nannocystis bainbridge]|uniref:MYXO-CTERM domain-containing protein n=1 Tax=Nannocystis bainbridge TaxID=2995303 RepID=A0ABT5E6X4_9BACT|nr:hypothetical protein [Nannocystis bainbridge]MDC0721612.1 hypothetical protein [Nannocystis bainbridge]
MLSSVFDSSTTRARLVAAMAGAALFVLPERPAAALSCDSPPWEEGGATNLLDAARQFPIDAQFWELRSCTYELDMPSNCRLERGDDVIPVDIDLDGADHCEVDPTYVGDGNNPDVIVRYVPTRSMIPNRAYVLACDTNGPPANNDSFQHTVVRSRLDPEPAAAPGSLDDLVLEYKRGDDGCCSTGDWMELQLDHEQTWLREGGYVEAMYDDGQVFVVNGPDPWSERIEMPPTNKGLALTPVAANGVRGETLRLERGDYDRELVYVACAFTRNPSPLALWLIAPLLWIGTLGRRRRRAVGGAS